MNVITNNKIRCTIALAALQNVMDPEIGLNVVDLGLIYQIAFDEAARTIYVSMTLTTQFCPMGQSLVDGVTRALQAVFTSDELHVNLTFDPEWTHEMISEDGQTFLKG